MTGDRCCGLERTGRPAALDLVSRSGDEGAEHAAAQAAALQFGEPHRQHRRGPFQRLNLRFSSTAKTAAFAGGATYQPTTSLILPVSSGSGGILKSCVRLGCSPKGRQIRCTLVGEMPACGPAPAWTSAWHPRPGLIAQPVQPAGQEPGPPPGHGAPADTQPGRDRGVVTALSARQHNPGPHRQTLGGALAPGPAF